MAEQQHYKCRRLMFKPSEEDTQPVERALNQMWHKGYELIEYSESMDGQDRLYVMMVFKMRDEQPSLELPRFAVEEKVHSAENRRMMEELAAAHDVVPIDDPLLAGLQR